MSLTHRHVVTAFLALAAACADAPMEPGQAHLLPAITARPVLPPGTTPASFGLVIDTVGIMITQMDTTCIECVAAATAGPRSRASVHQFADTVYVDSLIPWPADQESFAFRAEVPPPEPGFAIRVWLYYYSGGVSLFQGYSDVDFRRGNIRLPEIRMYYFGPGYLSDDIQLFPGDTAMAPGDTLQFVATAYQLALRLDTAYISWRVSDSTKARMTCLQSPRWSRE